MTALAAWHHDVTRLTHNLRRQGHHVGDLAHPPDAQCPQPCPACHLRHKGPCPCPVCYGRAHKGDCPPHHPGDPGRPGCLACQILDDTTRATELADLGDGIRSPDLAGGGHGKGGVSRPTETAADRIDHRDGDRLATSASHRRAMVDALRSALSVVGGGSETGTAETGLRGTGAKPGGGELIYEVMVPPWSRWSLLAPRSQTVTDTAAAWIREAATQGRHALQALHPLLPPARTTHTGGRPGCASCTRINQFSPTTDPPKDCPWCDWCYRWRNANGTLPPIGVLRARAEGRRITTRVVDEATRAERRPKHKRKKAG